MKLAIVFFILAALAGAASLMAGGPVSGDVPITRALQSLFGDRSRLGEISDANN